MARAYHQGIFKPKNPDKYIGKVDNIIYRSGWEKKFMLFCDMNPSVLKWASEEVVLKYTSPVDNKPHRYFIDFAMVVKTRSGEVKKYLVEIKPAVQTEPPKQSRNQKRYITEMETYAVNQAKWAAAAEFARKNNTEFIVITEKHLNV